MLITDETHRVASKTWQAIVTRLLGPVAHGLTATPERVDGWHVLLLPARPGPVAARAAMAGPAGTWPSPRSSHRHRGPSPRVRLPCAGSPAPAASGPSRSSPRTRSKQRVGLLRCPNKVKIGRATTCAASLFALSRRSSRPSMSARPGAAWLRTRTAWRRSARSAPGRWTSDRDVLVLTPG